MGLKIKQIQNFANEFGMTDKNTQFSVTGVFFNYTQFSVTLHWESTPSTWTAGMPKQQHSQMIGLADLGQSEIELLLAVSDALHEKAMNVPFIRTGKGLESFADLEANTIDVGNPFA